jgi:acetyl esterase/lipase
LELSTRQGYASILSAHFLPFFGRMPMKRIMPSTVRAWVTKVSSEGRISPVTIRTNHVMLHSVFRRAVRDRIIAFNPCSETELAKIVRKQNQTLTPEEYARPHAAIPERYQDFVQTCIETVSVGGSWSPCDRGTSRTTGRCRSPCCMTLETLQKCADTPHARNEWHRAPQQRVRGPSVSGVTSHRPHGRLRRRYGPHHDQFGDLHVSRSDPERGTVVLLHGGFWRPHRDLEMTRSASEALADLGWNVWNLEYRRGDGTSWKQTLNDCADGLEHLTELARELQIDTSTTILVGHSAGGQLAAWTASDAQRRRTCRITGLLTLNGVMHLGLAAELAIGNDAVAGFLGNDPAALDAADPSRRLPLGVPMRCLHGRQDERVPFAIGEAFHRLARSAGDDVELRQVLGTHTAPIEPGGVAWDAVRDSLNTTWPSRLESSEGSDR